MSKQYELWGDGMIHKCPICRHQPITELKNEELLCPECGWKADITKMVIEKTI